MVDRPYFQGVTRVVFICPIGLRPQKRDEKNPSPISYDICHIISRDRKIIGIVLSLLSNEKKLGEFIPRAGFPE
jgi:hypothetical protein